MEKTQPVLVTGGTGFVGRHLVVALKARGYECVYSPSSEDRDLRFAMEAYKVCEETMPHLIFHLAATCGGIGANQKRPVDFFRDNMFMGMNVLESARKFHAKVVMLGTVCSYPKYCPIPFREEDLWEGYPEETNAPYGVAKKALLTLAQAYRQQYGCNFVYLIPTNLYGPGDNFDLHTSHVIPALIRKMVAARTQELPTVTLWGDGSPSRDFLYVGDVVNAMIDAAEQYDGAAPVNIGSEREVDVVMLADTVKQIVGYKGNIFWDKQYPNGQPRRQLNTTRARQVIPSWKPKVALWEGLKTTIEWYEAISRQGVDP